MSDWVENKFLASSLEFETLSSFFFPVYKLSREYNQLENVWRCFWKSERSWCEGTLMQIWKVHNMLGFI